MPNYTNGKIYQITAEGFDPYIGSTTLPLGNRFSKFKTTKKHYSCSHFINHPSCKIELLEEYPCETRAELMLKEREWIDKTVCVNVARPIISDLEKREYHQSYNKTYTRKTPCAKPSKEKNAEYCRRWYLKKKEILATRTLVV
jgi:hypothetical protein